MFRSILVTLILIDPPALNVRTTGDDWHADGD
jgi:hypothetical protein